MTGEGEAVSPRGRKVGGVIDPSTVYVDWCGLSLLLFCEVDHAKRWVDRVNAVGGGGWLAWDKKRGGFPLVSILRAIQFRSFADFSSQVLFSKERITIK